MIALALIALSSPPNIPSIGTSPTYFRACIDARAGQSVYWDDTDDGLRGEWRLCAADQAGAYAYLSPFVIEGSTTPPTAECDAAGEAGRLYLDTNADTDGSVFFCRGAAGWKDIDDDGGAGGGAPETAEYIVGAADATLTAERVCTDTASIDCDMGTAAQAKFNVLAVTDAMVPNTITIDLATAATTANAGDSATAFFPSGTVEVARGGTGAAPGADDQVLVSDSTSAGTWRAVPDCGEAGTLNYTAATNSFSCLTDSGGGGGNSVEASKTITGTGLYSATVSAAWVAADSEIVCSTFGTTADGGTPELAALAGLVLSVSDRVVSTSFVLRIYAPYRVTGTFRFHCVGV